MKKSFMVFVSSFIVFLSFIGISNYCFAQEQAKLQRVISFGPSITEQIYLLESQERLVGVTSYCRTYDDEFEIIGTVIEVDIERIVYLNPDIVLATSLTNPKTVKKLENLGIKVVSFSLAESFSQMCEQFLQLGKILDKGKEADDIIRQAKIEVDRIKEKTKNLPKVKTLVQVGVNPLFVSNENSFVNDFVKFSGGVNVAGDTLTGLYSREKVLQDNPEVIIIISMGIVGFEEKKLWQKYKSLKAVKEDRIYVVDDYLFTSPSPSAFIKGLEAMLEMLHPSYE